jgi:hypothetical protein
MREPEYFVQTADRVLHAYWSRDILLINLRENRGEEVTILKRISGIPLRYAVVTEAELREPPRLA